MTKNRAKMIDWVSSMCLEVDPAGCPIDTATRHKYAAASWAVGNGYLYRSTNGKNVGATTKGIEFARTNLPDND